MNKNIACACELSQNTEGEPPVHFLKFLWKKIFLPP